MKRQTFTLIELLVVIAIIGILAAILIPIIGNAMESSRRTTCLNNYKTIGAAVVGYRADNKGLMPVATGNHQVPRNPRGKSKDYCINKTTGMPIGVLDYAYIKSFKLTSGPDSEGYCSVSSDTKKNGDVWLCPNTLKSLNATGNSDTISRAGFFLAEANRGVNKNTQYNYNFFSSDGKKPTHIPTNAPVSLDLCPMMAEMCANTCMTGAAGDPQKGYRSGKNYIPAPHAESYVVTWMDGHVEACPAEKTKDNAKKHFLNWQPINEDDKYYAPFGDRQQN